MLEEMFFLHHYFEVMFRRSFLINRILLNSEVWYGVTKYEIEELESVDHSLNRRILEAPAYALLRAWVIFIIMSRRLIFFQNPMKQE